MIKRVGYDKCLNAGTVLWYRHPHSEKVDTHSLNTTQHTLSLSIPLPLPLTHLVDLPTYPIDDLTKFSMTGGMLVHHPSDTPYQQTLYHTFSIHPLIHHLNTPSYTFSTHPLNSILQHTLSTHTLNPPYQHTLSIHPINTGSQ